LYYVIFVFLSIVREKKTKTKKKIKKKKKKSFAIYVRQFGYKRQTILNAAYKLDSLKKRSKFSFPFACECVREREMSSILEAIKPHVVCIPYPLQGHINPMLKLAKILHHKGFHVTFVNTHYNHRRLLKSRGPDSLDGLSDFRFETIPDGLPPSDTDVSQDIPALCDSTSKTCLIPLCNLLSKLNDSSSSNAPPVTCIISDASMTFTLEAAEEFGIPNVFLSTPSAVGCLAYMHCRHLVERGLTPLKGNTLTLLFIELYAGVY
jgi:hypothetical protein